MADFPGESQSLVNPMAVGGTAGPTTATSINFGSGSTFYYALACFDNVGTRHYWTDTAPTMAAAPTLNGGHTYITSTLVIMRKY